MDAALIHDVQQYVEENYQAGPIPPDFNLKNASEPFCGLLSCLTSESASNDLFGDLLKNANEELYLKLREALGKDAAVVLEMRRILDRKSNFQPDSTELDGYVPTTFFQALCKFIDQKEFRTDADFYNRIGMSRQSFARLRKDGTLPSKRNALLMAAGLGLNYEEASSLLQLAGYTLQVNSRQDVIVSYFLKKRKYTLDQVDETLYCLGEKPLRLVLGDIGAD
jgi:hypothetical protein